MERNGAPTVPLTARELEIVKLVATGATNQQIALELVISVNTVKVHLRNIFQKLGVESRTEATTYAVRQGWVVLEGMPPPGEEEAPPLPTERIGPWQRVSFVATALLVAVLAFFPPTRNASDRADSPFTDHATGALSGAPDAASTRWETRAQMPTSRARLAVVAYGGKVYAIGGDSPDGVSGALEVYDPASDTWSRRASKPRPVRNIGAAVLGDLIYVPGGYSPLDQAVAAVEVYDPQDDAWSEAASLPEPLFAYAIASVHGRLYLFGGSDGVGYLNTVWIYDPRDDSWTGGTPMSDARGFAAAAVVGERIYVLGGYDGQTESSACAVYDPAREVAGDDPWTSFAAMLNPRGGLAAVTVDGFVYAIGGGWTQYVSFNERYDLAQDSWSHFESPVLGQWRTLGAAAIESETDTVIHVVGGWSDRYLSTNYAYSAVFRIFLPGTR